MVDSNVNKPKALQLPSPKDWKLWYAFMLQQAIYAEVVDFVDIKKPDRAMDVQKPQMPELPELTQEGKFEWDAKLKIWKIKLVEFEKMKKRMEKIGGLIWNTVSLEDMQCPTGFYVDVKDVLKALEARFSPSISS
ncbi:hypothetical protein AJ78_04047 [Emergomyces pasteurianus Ep9510]|uniref:Uncharacterized protein n=1 Tax=Emergomyces pasteurianus Ep9510 TaxID=1447872 RepID=A0A1J9PH14_9EURO|nr:hypothetical protein AJ78_04047 [Emergomyces pasteurianus Ep9510]